MSTEQWIQFGDRTRLNKVRATLRSQWGQSWCVEKGVEPTETGMMKALDDGVMSWHVSVIQCLQFDNKILQKLIKG
jgi:hypothetical protein